jgi:hypothetical protein
MLISRPCRAFNREHEFVAQQMRNAWFTLPKKTPICVTHYTSPDLPNQRVLTQTLQPFAGANPNVPICSVLLLKRSPTHAQGGK